MYWVCSQYNVVPEKKLKQVFIGAILLKWIRNGNITVTKAKKDYLVLKTVIRLWI